MKFGPVPVADAAGAILAHSRKAGGRTLRKGRVLTADDVAALAAAGVDSVVAARLDPDDVAEDEAARRIAAAAMGPGLTASAPFTGRVNLFAEHPGLAVVDPDRLDALNLVDEAITIATLPPNAPVAAGDMVATIKIIPFAAPGPAVDVVVAAASAAAPLIRVAPFRPLAARLIQTTLPGIKDSVLDKTVDVTRARVAGLGGTLAGEERTPHDPAAVAAAIARARAAGADLVLIAGASAIVDRRDVLPAGIEAAGGVVEHFGMPVDPGNLLLLGRLHGTPVLGLPGCARSPKMNGFDWVLQRLAAGVPVGRGDVMRMGAGGLLAEIPTRPQPRAGDGPPTAPRAPRIAALVLAAGPSRRMGPANKLLLPVDGAPMLARTLDAVLAAKARPVIIVTGHQRESVEAAVAGRPVTVVHNPDYAAGLSTSLKAGIAALPADVDGVVVCLGDMPRVGAAAIDRLIAAFNPVEGRAICVPTAGGKRGNPVLWARRFFPEMTAVSGDVGARHLVAAHADQVVEVEVGDPGVLLDLDTPEALAALAASPPAAA
ncbi:MAG: molybdopterin-binding/glycosyltransferase family 2 protein [Alphaproteobacteria bacterium]|nr:molybdopterin-binding/glycosyltransferase family 2 protein [Alphaproteobacteria bacterium]